MMDANNMEWIFGIAGLATGAAVTGALLFPRLLRSERDNAALAAELAALGALNAHAENQFKASAQEALKGAHESFLQLAQERLKQSHMDGAHDLEKRQKAISDLVDPVHKNLESLGKALEQIRGTDTALREDLKQLSRETAKLVGAMRDPAAQGKWGEFILEGVLEKSGLIRGIHYDTQPTLIGKRQRPDVVINMQDGFKIYVDAKAPVNEVAARLGEVVNEEEYNNLMKNLARQVRDRAKELGNKDYWEDMDGVDFVVMFLPSEHVYSVALRFDPELIDFALQRGVVIASPTLLMSLLRVVSLSWRQVDLAKNAQEISERGYDLYKRLLTFTDHMGKVGLYLQRAMGGYDEAVGSLQTSVLPAGRKFKELQSRAGLEELPDLKAVEKAPRPLTLGSDDEKEKKRA